MAVKDGLYSENIKSVACADCSSVQATDYAVKSPMGPLSRAVKRTVDIIAAAVMLPVVILLAIVIGLAIKIDSKGPVFFRQPRVGKDGRLFMLYKFRSMYEGAAAKKQELNALNEASGPIFKMRRDPRITRVGAFIRKTSIDELPQIVNVLRGEMSLVGPRPPLPLEVEKYNRHQYNRLAVKPGLTCLWQIKGRSNIPFDKWVELDIEYIKNQSLLLDLVILLKTIPAVLRGTGAW